MAQSIIAIGSKNPAKVQAVVTVLSTYKQFADLPVFSEDVKSGVSSQPTNLDETICGAVNRAAKALELYPSAIMAFGIESGIVAPFEGSATHLAPSSMGRFVEDALRAHPALDVCACAILKTNGRWVNLRVGLSSAWPLPGSMSRRIQFEGMNMNDAAIAVGLTDDPSIGSHQGAVGVLSEGRLDRNTYTQQAVLAAMIGWMAQ